MTFKQIAQALGLAPSTVTRWAQRGCPTHSVEAVQAWRSTHLRARMRPPPQGSGNDLPAGLPEAGRGYWQARSRREQAEAALAERRLAQEAAGLVDRATLERAVAAVMRQLRARLLALPADVVPALAAHPSPAAMDGLLRAAITRTLQDVVDTAAASPSERRGAR